MRFLIHLIRTIFAFPKSSFYDGNRNGITARGIARGVSVEGTTSQTYSYDGRSRITRATDDNAPQLQTDDSVVEYEYNSLDARIVERQAINGLPKGSPRNEK